MCASVSDSSTSQDSRQARPTVQWIDIHSDQQIEALPRFFLEDRGDWFDLTPEDVAYIKSIGGAA